MNNYISIKVVLDNILDHPLLKDVSLERAINHTINFIRIVGCPRIYTDKVVTLEVVDYRALLPDDCDEITQVRSPYTDGNYKTFRYTTDTFHLSGDKQESDLTYKVQGNVIFTSIKEGTIDISYRAIPVDDCGHPMIPDNSSFLRALELYIKKQYFTILFDLGKINHMVYNNVLQEYAWAVGQAQSDLIRPSIDQMQSISNMWNKLLISKRDHDESFINQGAR